MNVECLSSACWFALLFTALLQGGVNAAPRNGDTQFLSSETSSSLSDLFHGTLASAVVVLVAVLLLPAVVICCRSRRRHHSSKTELDGDAYKDTKLDDAKWTEALENHDGLDNGSNKLGFSENEGQKFSPEKPSANFPSLLFVTLPLPPPLPLPLPPSDQSLEGDKKVRKSFRLKEWPFDSPQRLNLQSIPVPKIVQTYRHNNHPPNNNEIKLSPFMHRRNPELPIAATRSEEVIELEQNGGFTSPVQHHKKPAISLEYMDIANLPLVAPCQKKNLSKDASKTPVNSFEQTRRSSQPPYLNQQLFSELSESEGFEHSKPVALQHAMSLDELLETAGSKSLTLDLDPTKKSKYSRVTITASLDMLNPSQQIPNNTDFCECLSSHSVGMVEPSSVDSTSVLSYVLTNDMLGSNELSQSCSEVEGSTNSCHSSICSSLAGDGFQKKHLIVDLEISGVAAEEELRMTEDGKNEKIEKLLKEGKEELREADGFDGTEEGLRDTKELENCNWIDKEVDEANVEENGSKACEEGNIRGKKENVVEKNKEVKITAKESNSQNSSNNILVVPKSNISHEELKDSDSDVISEPEEELKSPDSDKSKISEPEEELKSPDSDEESKISEPKEGLKGSDSDEESKISEPEEGLRGSDSDDESKISEPEEEFKCLDSDGELKISKPEEELKGPDSDKESKISKPQEELKGPDSDKESNILEPKEELKGLESDEESSISEHNEELKNPDYDKESNLSEPEEEELEVLAFDEEPKSPTFEEEPSISEELKEPAFDEESSISEPKEKLKGPAFDEEPNISELDEELKGPEFDEQSNNSDPKEELKDPKPEEELKLAKAENEVTITLSEYRESFTETESAGIETAKEETILVSQQIVHGTIWPNNANKPLDHIERAGNMVEETENHQEPLSFGKDICSDLVREKEEDLLSLLSSIESTEKEKICEGDREDEGEKEPEEEEEGMLVEEKSKEMEKSSFEVIPLDTKSDKIAHEINAATTEVHKDGVETETEPVEEDKMAAVEEENQGDLKVEFMETEEAAAVVARESMPPVNTKVEHVQHEEENDTIMGLSQSGRQKCQIESERDTEVCTVILKFEPEASSENWPTVMPVNQAPEQSMDCGIPAGLLRPHPYTPPGRRSAVLVSETTPNLVEGRNKDTYGSFENLGPFYTSSHVKTRLMPIPTPPPSPPRNRHRITPELEKSQQVNSPCLRPTSTLSLPSMSGQFSSSPVPLYRTLPPVPSCASSVPSSPVSPPSQQHPEFSERTKRLYISNSPYISSSDSDSDEGILQRSNFRRRPRIKRFSAQPSTGKSFTPSSPFISPETSPRHSSARRKTSKDDENRQRDSDVGPTCLNCGEYLSFILKGEPTKAGSKSDNVPIYYVLERPSLCQQCLEGDSQDEGIPRVRSRSKTSTGSLPPLLPPRDSPPLPPLPTPPSVPFTRNTTTEEDPVYETVVSTREKSRDNTKETGISGRKLPPVSLEFTRRSREFHTSSDYESITSFESSLNKDRTKPNIHIKNGNTFHMHDSFEASSHDYETISSLDYSHKSIVAKLENVDMHNGYARIPISHDIEEADSPLETPPSYKTSPSKDKRSKLMKIDSHGYASVLPLETKDNFWEFNSLHNHNQDREKSEEVSPSRRSRTSNPEEAWRHQQQRGYATISMKPPPMSRTSSDGILCNSLSLVAPGSSPRDYEVPIPRHPPPPPMAISNRKKTSSPLVKQNPVFSPTTEHKTFLSEGTSQQEEACGDIAAAANPSSSSSREDYSSLLTTKDAACDTSRFLSVEKTHPKRKHSASDVMGLEHHAISFPLPYNSQ